MITYMAITVDDISGHQVLFEKSGELPSRTRRVQIIIGDGKPWGNFSCDQATELIETAFATNHARADAYFIIPAPVQELPEDVKQHFKELALEKKANRGPTVCITCEKEFVQGRGRPSKYCPTCRAKTKTISSPNSPSSTGSEEVAERVMEAGQHSGLE